MTDDSVEAILARGRAAEGLLSNPALQEALDTLANDAIGRWRATPARDIDGREILYAHISAIDGLRALLETRFEHARAAAHQIAKNQERTEAKARRSTRSFGLNTAR